MRTFETQPRHTTHSDEGQKMAQVKSDEDVGRQILGIFLRNKIRAGGTLRRNQFIEVRDADFQRGIKKAVEKNWIKIKIRDRYTYELTDAGLMAC